MLPARSFSSPPLISSVRRASRTPSNAATAESGLAFPVVTGKPPLVTSQDRRPVNRRWPSLMRWVGSATATALVGWLVVYPLNLFGLEDVQVAPRSAPQPVSDPALRETTNDFTSPCGAGSPTSHPPQSTNTTSSPTTGSPIEGAIGVANYTKGDTEYSSVVVADFDDVVKIQVYCDNRLADGSSVIRNFTVGVDLPHTAGESQTVKAPLSWDGGLISDLATVHMRPEMCLQILSGRVNWRHNVAPTGGSGNGSSQSIFL